MDKQVYIEEGGQMVTRRKWKLLGGPLLYVGVQLLWGVLCVFFVAKFHPKPFWCFYTVQWVGILVIFYLQLRTAKREGVTLIFAGATFKKWQVLQAGEQLPVLLIFKTERTEDGYTACRCYPFWPSNKRRITFLKFQLVKMRIFLKLIN
jgi:hypothetical protein